ncbi:hypothetical protein ACWGR3_28900 [Streptomyces albidoflavus]
MTKVLMGNIRGPQGPQGAQGPQGSPGPAGPNTVPTNDAIAAAVTMDGPAKTAVTAAAAVVRNLSSAVLLGDSRTLYNGNYLQSQATSTAVTHDDRGYVACAMVLLRQRLDILKNGGVGGDTTAQMLARTDALLALSPGWLIGMGCINSVNQGVSAATIIAELTAIFDKCAAKGVRVVWGTDWISAGTDTTAKKQAAATVNEWLRRETSRRREFYLADYAAVMSTPATGLPVAAYASDGLHQDGPGGFIMAKELVKVLEPLLPPMDRLTVSNEDTTNILTNGMLTGNGGTGRATSWSWPGSGPAVFSKVARTDGYQGDWQQVVVTGGTNTYLYQQVAAAAGKWAEGDNVFFECEFETDATDWNVTAFYARLNLLGVTGVAPQTVADDMNHAGAPGLAYRPERGVFRTPVLRIHEGTTHVQGGIFLIGTGTYRIARARMVKVS